MQKYLLLPLFLLLAVGVSRGQLKNRDDINKQIKELKAEKSIFFEYEPARSSEAKIIAAGKEFSEAERKRAGVESMNFGLAFFFPCCAFKVAPQEILFTFRVESKKPRFAASHVWTATVGSETIDFGEARYAARAKDNMEYLNFKISRANLEKIARGTDVKFKLGETELNFTPEHLQLFANFLKVSDPASF